MSKSLMIQVTVYDDETGRVEDQFIEHYNGSYGYEVRTLFTKLGEQVAPKIDPYDGRGDT